MDKIPTRVKQVLKDNALAIARYNYRNIGYRGKVYTIHYSGNVGGYYATFTAYKTINYSHNVPYLYSEQLND